MLENAKENKVFPLHFTHLFVPLQNETKIRSETMKKILILIALMAAGMTAVAQDKLYAEVVS